MEIWRETVGKPALGLDTEMLPGHAFLIEGMGRQLDNAFAGVATMGGVRDSRSRERLADGKDDFVFSAPLDGAPGLMTHRGREVAVHPGEVVLWALGEPGSFAYHKRSRGIAIRVPRAALAAFTPDPENFAARIMPRCATTDLLRGYAASIASVELPISDVAQRAIAQHLIELIMLGLRDAFGMNNAVNGAGLRAATLHAIKQDILARLYDMRLSLGAVAARHRLGPRTLQRLFEEDGTTFSAFVLSHRLARAYEILRDPAYAHRKISDIAADAGFSDISAFNRFFRNRYDATPGDIRRMI